MRCPQCGHEVASGKFCSSCGAPVEAAAAFQPQPPHNPYAYPPPMPPKKSLTWLWVTLGAVGAVVVLGLAVLLLLGDDPPVDPTPKPGPSAGPVASAGAEQTLKAYMDARLARDSTAAYNLLSAKARQAYTLAEFTAFYKDSTLAAYGKIELLAPQDQWQPVLIHDMKNRTQTFSAVPYMLIKEGDGYRVALDNPLNDKVDTAFDAKNYPEVLKLTDQMLAINPQSYYGHHNLGWALVETGQYAQALTSFDAAARYAAPEDLPETIRSAGVAHLRASQWDQAIAKFTEAKAGAVKLGSTFYQTNWLSQVDADTALAYEKAGKFAQAIDLLEPIYRENPGSTVGLSLVGRLERKPYQVKDGWATYKLIKHGVAFALPQDWVVSTETTGGDWWFARHPASPATKTDMGVYFHGDSLGKTMDEAVAGLLKYYQEPIGAPKRDVTIVDQDTYDIEGRPAAVMLFSDNTISLLLKVKTEWIDFHWFYNPDAQKAAGDWSRSLEVTW